MKTKNKIQSKTEYGLITITDDELVYTVESRDIVRIDLTIENPEIEYNNLNTEKQRQAAKEFEKNIKINNEISKKGYKSILQTLGQEIEITIKGLCFTMSWDEFTRLSDIITTIGTGLTAEELIDQAIETQIELEETKERLEYIHELADDRADVYEYLGVL